MLRNELLAPSNRTSFALAALDAKFPMPMWDHLIEQIIITINLLRQSKVHPHVSAWVHYKGFLDYNATPMVPAWCKVLTHEPVKNGTSWGFRAIEGQYTGPATHHYRNFTVFSTKTRSVRTSDTVEFRQASIIATQITSEDIVINASTALKRELAAISTPNGSNKLETLANLR